MNDINSPDHRRFLRCLELAGGVIPGVNDVALSDNHTLIKVLQGDFTHISGICADPPCVSQKLVGFFLLFGMIFPDYDSRATSVACPQDWVIPPDDTCEVPRMQCRHFDALIRKGRLRLEKERGQNFKKLQRFGSGPRIQVEQWYALYPDMLTTWEKRDAIVRAELGR